MWWQRENKNIEYNGKREELQISWNKRWKGKWERKENNYTNSYKEYRKKDRAKNVIIVVDPTFSLGDKKGRKKEERSTEFRKGTANLAHK